MQRRKFLSVTTAAVSTAAVSTAAVSTGAAGVLGAEASPLTRDKKGFIVKSGEARSGVHTPFQGVNPNDVKISGKDTDGQMAVFEYIGTQKVGPPLHVHYKQDEVFYVVEGEYRFQLGTEQSILKAGDTIFLPRNIPHTWIQLTDSGKLIYMLNPAGQLEEFFVKLSSLQGPPTPADLDKLMLAHEMKNVGPPLTLG
ncbi:cupin domain-containing protein [Telluribacter sp. SYSU D00476]|uniref:cupin domain-containing protein n=1 Tax=Telluribacter sp. SYSU D00476 TaxID=2811430 RepID=UPI001FF2D6EC|nr:cupin domain-containing protein [Telluribacter sp. SYSU D00476]